MRPLGTAGRGPRMRGWRLAIGAAAVVGFLAAGIAGAHAQAASTLPPGPPIPRTSEGTPDLSGIWRTLGALDYDIEPHGGRPGVPPGRGIVRGGAVPYQPWALEQRAKHFANRATADPRTKCFTLGTPRGIYSGEPFQIFQRPRDVTIVHGFGHSVRTIHTNGTEHPEGPLDFWAGDSRARWEGDTLVVDVVYFNGETWLDRAGNFHSDALHVVERWTPIDAYTLRYEAALEDPKVYTRPWTLEVLLYRDRDPGAQLIENYCYTHGFDEFYPFPAGRGRTR